MLTDKLILTDENYFSKEADQEFLSVSQFKNFKNCEAQAIAKLKGEWIDEENTALLVGNYVHSHFENQLDKFKMEHPEIFTKQGELKSQYQQANKMIQTIDNDEFCKWILEGQSEVIITGEVFGAKWKCKMDRYNLEKERFVDLKTTRSFEKVYDPRKGCRVSFAEFWGYDIQLAMYREIEAAATGRSNRLTGYIVAVTKDDYPDKAILSVDLDSINKALKEVEEYVPRILDLKAGKEIPVSCGKCDYCKSHKQLDRIVNYKEI